MIYIVHGNNLSTSRKLILNQQRKIGVPRTELNLNDLSPQDLYNYIFSSDLFGNPIFLVIDISTNRKTNLDEYVEVLKKTPINTTIIILSSKSLPNRHAFIKNAKDLNAKVTQQETLPESNVFKFVDSVIYRNRRASYLELEKLLKDDTDPFRIFSSLCWGVRNISLAKFKSPSFEKQHGFIKGKAKKQAESYSEDKIKDITKEFYNIDKKVKTGLITPDMVVTLAMEKVLNS